MISQIFPKEICAKVLTGLERIHFKHSRPTYYKKWSQFFLYFLWGIFALLNNSRLLKLRRAAGQHRTDGHYIVHALLLLLCTLVWDAAARFRSCVQRSQARLTSRFQVKLATISTETLDLTQLYSAIFTKYSKVYWKSLFKSTFDPLARYNCD